MPELEPQIQAPPPHQLQLPAPGRWQWQAGPPAKMSRTGRQTLQKISTTPITKQQRNQLPTTSPHVIALVMTKESKWDACCAKKCVLLW
jgi:hypothetical protein